MTVTISFALITFTTLLPMVDPFGNMSIFAALTDGMPQPAVKRIAVKSCIFALVTLLAFAFFGEQLFELFGITINGLKIVGGIIFVIMGYDMLQAHVARTKVSNPPTPEEEEELDDIALTPLGIPLLCGPGAMTAAIIQGNATESSAEVVGLLLGTVGIMLLAFMCLIGSKKIVKLIGPSGNKVILRLMGLLLMIIAVESFFSGLTPIVRNMLGIE